ncbi:DUF6622 family protein [Microvirga flavescens]|uniref:DUF6622 family protein n=1 Tax=Microvirga flavescens TaxID=2249811 RepID=UPI000DD7B758|nr:DUF6622 family protein [Microvirga flavescens]
MIEAWYFLLAVVKNTPLWTWLLLAYLIFRGVRAMRRGVASLWRLSIVPMAFAIWGIWGVFERYHASSLSIAIWIASIGLGLVSGALLASRIEVRVDKKKKLLELPGSPLSLLSILGVFSLKYVLTVLAVIQPKTAVDVWFVIVDVGTTGLVAGAFGGRFINLWQRCQTAPSSVELVET